MKIKRICKYCGKEFESNGKVFCSSECHTKNVIKNHTFICATCGASFYSKYYKQKYCSRECEYESLRTADREHTCIACGKDFIRPQRTGDACRFCSRECAFEYKSNISRHKKYSARIRKCGRCEKIFFINGSVSKYCSDACRKSAAKQAADDATKRRFIAQKKECKNCGRIFTTEFKGDKSFCSSECRERYLKEYKHIHTHHRLDGIVIDRDITLAKLNERDNGICQLCMQPVDWNDYKIDNAGSWITGARYPSIDHIYPICMGGKHEWSNVQLAHFRCNSLKGAGAG